MHSSILKNAFGAVTDKIKKTYRKVSMQWFLLEFFPEILIFFDRFKEKFTSTKSLLLYPVLSIFLILFYLNVLEMIYYWAALSIFVSLVFLG